MKHITSQTQTFDFIIVGAGAAGCVLANRLSEDPGVRVLLVEAGGKDSSHIIRMPVACALAARDSRFDWAFTGEPEPHCNGRRILQHRGKVLGGSTSINGLVANRGNPLDYDAWALEGLSDWSFDHCLPYFRKMETFGGGIEKWRGGEGPQPIERCSADHPLYQAFLEAGPQAGHNFTEDQNGEHHEGFHVGQSFTKNGQRCSAATAYLHPVKNRENLTVLTNTVVHRILFDGVRAVGVSVVAKARSRQFLADREVILSAGAIGSPHLLLLSGVGDAEQLKAHDLPLKMHRPAVGKNLEDHPIVPVQYLTPDGLSISHKFRGLGRYRIGLQWILSKTGLGASTLCEAGAFFRSSDDCDYADLQHEFYPVSAEMGDPEANFDDGFMFSMGLMRPESRGHIRLRSADPTVPPGITYNYFSTERDKRVMIDGIRRTREIAEQPAFDGLRLAEVAPGHDVASDAAILEWLREAVSTEYHPCSTCRMGLDDNSVTDHEGKVHEVDGLRVIDASIMPHNVTANLNAPVLMLAEKLADAVMGRDALPASDTISK